LNVIAPPATNSISGGRALDLRTLDQLTFTELSLVEAHRADEGPPAFLGELLVQPTITLP
jgi:hypothetical protein